MLSGIPYRYRLWKLQRRKARIIRAYQFKLEEAKQKRSSNDEIDNIRYDERMDCDFADNEIIQLQSRHLISEAEKLLLPTPDFDSGNKNWIESNINGKYHLSLAAAKELRSAIRKEQLGRSENVRAWFTSLTGLIGTIIGLLALTLQFFHQK